MIAIIVDNHVHRLLENGIMQSAPLHGSAKVSINLAEFEDRDTAEMNLHPWEKASINQELKVLASAYPSNRHPEIVKEVKEEARVLQGTDVRE